LNYIFLIVQMEELVKWDLKYKSLIVYQF